MALRSHRRRNPAAARYAEHPREPHHRDDDGGHGALAGLAGTVDTLGLNFRYAPEFTGGAGFGGDHHRPPGQDGPLGRHPRGALIGALYGGAGRMQLTSGVRSEIIQVVQALVLMLVAAPEIIRALYRFRERRPGRSETTLTTGWGG